MRQNRPSPHTATTVLAAANAQEITVKGPTDDGLKAVHYVAIAHDEQKTTVPATPLQDVTVKIVPQHRTDAFGGNVAHSFYGQPSASPTSRNMIGLGFTLKPGEDVDVTLESVTGGTIVWTLHRWLDYGNGGYVPMPYGPGGVPLVR